jgi:hypothetical protein
VEDRPGATFGFFFVVGVVFFFGVLEWLMVVFLLVLVSFVFRWSVCFLPCRRVVLVLLSSEANDKVEDCFLLKDGFLYWM